MTPTTAGPASWAVQAGRATAAAARHWPLALALYAPSALLAVVATIPILVGGATLSRYGPWLSRLAAGDSLNVLVDLSTSAATSQSTDPDLEVVGLALPAAMLLVLAGVLLNGLAYTILSGGILERLRGGSTGFWESCRRWTTPMLRFGILAVLVFAGLGGVGLVGLAALPATRPAVVSSIVVAAALWLGYVDGALELGRASLVVHEDRRASRGLGRILGLPGRPRLLGRASLLWLLLALVSLGFWGVAGSALTRVPATALVLAIVVQQTLALLSAWLKLWRLAVAVELAQQTPR